jgi:hypothetical protein
MLKAKGTLNGKETVFIGLSFGNLEKFRQGPLDSFIKIDGAEWGLPCDLLIFSGRNEAEMADMVAQGLTPDAKVIISDKLKS